jgi:hypothetical protein
MKLVDAELAKPPTLGFDYSALDAETWVFVEGRARAIHEIARVTAAGIVHIGKNLSEVKEQLGHGEFLKWIEGEFAWTHQTAMRFMHVYECSKNNNLLNLNIDVSALYLIAAPSMPPPLRRELISRAASEKITSPLVREIVKEYHKTGNEDVAVGKLFEAVREAKREEAELQKSMPSPAEARRTAIATGAHTLDRNGNYQPPMTVEDQQRWREDRIRVSPISDFVRFATEPEVGSPRKYAELIHSQSLQKDFELTRQAAGWLAEFAEALCIYR